MSKVISFRLDNRNPREAEALQVLACHQEQGYSIRQILTDALLKLKTAETEHEVNRHLAEILTSMSSINDNLERLARNDVPFLGQPQMKPFDLSDAFVLSVKSAARPGLAFEV